MFANCGGAAEPPLFRNQFISLVTASLQLRPFLLPSADFFLLARSLFSNQSTFN
jgi:hypothetical protein